MYVPVYGATNDEHVGCDSASYAPDGWSLHLFWDEVNQLYKAFIQGRTSPLKDPEIQYTDYALWQRKRLQEEEVNRQLDYWKYQLRDLEHLELPRDRIRPAIQTNRGSGYRFVLNSRLVDRLKQLSRRHESTLFMTILAAFEVLLYRYTNQVDFAIGSPVANRSRKEIEGLIGFFVNILVLRSDLEGVSSFEELLDRVRETTLEAYSHQDLPFERLVEELHQSGT